MTTNFQPGKNTKLDRAEGGSSMRINDTITASMKKNTNIAACALCLSVMSNRTGLFVVMIISWSSVSSLHMVTLM